MKKKLELKILLLLLLLMFSLAGCRVANKSEEKLNPVSQAPEVESLKKTSSPDKETVKKSTIKPESKSVFTKLFVYFFPNSEDFILIPDSWENAYGVIESTDSILFLHNNMENIYAPLMEVKRYKSEKVWLNKQEENFYEKDGVYIELGKSDGIIYGAKVFTTNPYRIGDKSNSELAQDFDTVSADFYSFLTTFNFKKISAEVRNKKNDLMNGSAFNLKIVEKLEDEKEPIAISSRIDEKENGVFTRKYGYINKYGEFVIPSIYDEASPFKDGVAIVRKGNYYGVINKEGQIVLDIKYDYLKDYSEGYIVYLEYDTLKEGYMDLQGNILIPAQYQRAYPFSEGKAVVMTTKGLYGYIDKKGKTFIRPRFSYAQPYFQHIAYADGQGKTTYLGADGFPLFDFNKPPMYPETFKSTPFINGVMFKKYFPNEEIEWTEADYYDHMNKVEWLMVNQDNKSITNTTFDQVNYAKENPFFTVKKDDEWLIIDKEANVIEKVDYDMICPENNGFSINKNNQWGFLNKNFEEVIPPLYNTVTEFHNGIATAELCGLKLFINDKGDIFYCAVDHEETHRDNLVKIPFEMTDITGANAIQIFDYRMEDFEKAFSGSYYTASNNLEHSNLDLCFEKAGIQLSFIGNVPRLIEMTAYDEVLIGDSMDKVLATIKSGSKTIGKHELNYNIGGHLLRFQLSDNERVDRIILYCLEESARYFRNVESDKEINDEYDSLEMTFTLSKDNQVTPIKEGDKPLKLLKWVNGRLKLYLDIELLMDYIGGDYSLNEQTGTIRIDYLESIYYYKNKFWQNKNGDYFEEGDGTFVLNGRCYLEASYIHDFFEYTVVWNQEDNQVSLTYNPDGEMLYPIEELPTNKMLVYTGGRGVLFEQYREVFMVDSIVDIYRRELPVVPDTPNTTGDFKVKIIQNFFATESADYRVSTDDTWSKHYLKQEDTYHRLDDIVRLQAGENILVHDFDEYFPKNLSVEKIAPHISEEALIYQLEEVIESGSKIVYVIDRINNDGKTSLLEIAPSDEPIILCLASLKEVNWLIKNPNKVSIKAIVYGKQWYEFNRSTVAGDIDNIPMYYSDKMLSPRALIIGNQPVSDDYAYNQSKIEKEALKFDEWVRKIFGKQPYSLTYIEKDRTTITDQIILDETYYMYLNEIAERIKERQ